MKSRVCITVKNSPNPSSVYVRLYKHRRKVFYCFNKITFPRKKKNSLFSSLIKREILTSREVLYTKLNVRVISSCKDASKKGFSRLKCQLKRKNGHSMSVKTFGTYLSNYCTFRTKCYYILDLFHLG